MCLCIVETPVVDLPHFPQGIYSPLSYAILSGQGKIVRDLLERKQLDTSTSGVRYFMSLQFITLLRLVISPHHIII